VLQTTLANTNHRGIRTSSSTSTPFEISELQITLPQGVLSREVTLAQLTDFHFGAPTPSAHLERAVAITRELKPDLILLTGDYLQLHRQDLRYFIAKLLGPKPTRWVNYRRKVRGFAREFHRIVQPLASTAETLAVFGNHDYYEGAGTIKRHLPSDIKWLKNESREFQLDSLKLHFGGLDDFTRGKPNLKKLTEHAKASRGDYKILLAHNPDVTLDSSSEELREFDLILCGHTHGGQICPLGRPIFTRTVQKDHVSGLSYFGDTAIYVSRGVGYGTVQLRVNCAPEITLIRFVPQAAS